MIKITQNFYRAKTRMAIHRWFTTLCLTAALLMGAVEQINAQTATFSVGSATIVNNGTTGATFNEFGRYYLEQTGIGKLYRQTSANSSISLTASSTCDAGGSFMTATSGTIMLDGASVSSKYVHIFYSGDYDITGIQMNAVVTTAGRTITGVATFASTGVYPNATGNYTTLSNVAISGSTVASGCSNIGFTCTGGTYIPKNTFIAIIESGSGIQPSSLTISYKLACTPATISGTASTSIGSSTTLTPSVGGGTWSSSDTNVATVGTSSGVVTGVGVGTATITYTLSGCPATKDVTVLGDAKYFRSKANGVWSAAGTWESSTDGVSNWVTAVNAPDANAKGIEITAGTTVTLGANLTTPLPTVNNTIQVNGTLAASTFTLTLGSDISVNAGGTLSIAGTTTGQLVTTGKVLTVLGALTNTNTSATSVTSSATTLLFATASGAGVYNLNGSAVQIPVAAWVNGSNYSTINYNSTASAPTSGGFAAGQTYGDVVLASSSSATRIFNLNSLDLALTFRDVTFNTANAQITTSGGGKTLTLNIRDYNQAANVNLTNYGLTVNINASRNFTVSGGTCSLATTNAAARSTVTVDGDFNITSGTCTIASFAGAIGALNVKGNVSVASGASLTQSAGTAGLTFNGSVAQTFSNAGTISGAIDVSVANGANVALNTPLTANTITVNSGTLTVKSGTNLTVQNGVVNNSGNLTIENNANLIQVNTSNAINTGNVTVKRNSNALKRLDYTMWSSPVSGTQTLAGFSPLTSQSPNRFYTYNSLNNKYAEVTPTNNFAQGTGYLIRMPNEDPANLGGDSPYVLSGAAITYNGVFTGVPNNGTVNLTGLTAGQYVAVGNPYPSTISANAFIDANADVPANGVLYYWRKTNNINQGTSPTTSYATYTKAGGVANDGFTPGADIAVGQGFITTVPSSGTIAFTNTMRSSSNSAQFLRTKVTNKDRVWLNLSAGTDTINQMMVAYMDGATPGVDAGIDGKYINDSALALTSSIDGDEYVIQGRPAFDASDVVPLNFKTDTAGSYTIAIDHADGVFAAGQDVILVDAAAGTETSLKSGNYTFTAPAGTANSRFSLKYQKALGVNDAVYNESSVTVYKNKGAVSVNSGAALIAGVKVYDIQGRLLAELKDVKASSAAVSGLKAANQVLVVQVALEDGAVVTKKVVN